METLSIRVRNTDELRPNIAYLPRFTRRNLSSDPTHGGLSCAFLRSTPSIGCPAATSRTRFVDQSLTTPFTHDQMATAAAWSRASLESSPTSIL